MDFRIEHPIPRSSTATRRVPERTFLHGADDLGADPHEVPTPGAERHGTERHGTERHGSSPESGGKPRGGGRSRSNEKVLPTTMGILGGYLCVFLFSSYWSSCSQIVGLLMMLFMVGFGLNWFSPSFGPVFEDWPIHRQQGIQRISLEAALTDAPTH